MDRLLQERLLKISEHIGVLKAAERTYLELDASKRSMAAQLFLKAKGSSVAEREANAYSSDDWVNFSKGLAEAETVFNYERRNYELKLKAFDAEYLSYKIENSAIMRQK